MNYAKIQTDDIVNGQGLRVSLWVSGCRRHCKGCFNESAWDFTFGKKFDQSAFNKLMKELNDTIISGLSILGGEPFEPENVVMINAICSHIKAFLPDKNIWVYTGNTFEELKAMNRPHVENVLRNIDVLVDGEYKEELRDLELSFRGSSNQRIIDVQKSLEKGKVVLWNTSYNLQ